MRSEEQTVTGSSPYDSKKKEPIFGLDKLRAIVLVRFCPKAYLDLGISFYFSGELATALLLVLAKGMSR